VGSPSPQGAVVATGTGTAATATLDVPSAASTVAGDTGIMLPCLARGPALPRQVSALHAGWRCQASMIPGHNIASIMIRSEALAPVTVDQATGIWVTSQLPTDNGSLGLFGFGLVAHIGMASWHHWHGTVDFCLGNQAGQAPSPAHCTSRISISGNRGGVCADQ
jgi:hypothetical protein